MIGEETMLLKAFGKIVKGKGKSAQVKVDHWVPPRLDATRSDATLLCPVNLLPALVPLLKPTLASLQLEINQLRAGHVQMLGKGCRAPEGLLSLDEWSTCFGKKSQ